MDKMSNALSLETASMHHLDAKQKARKHAEDVAQQFETIFVQSLVGSLRQTGSIGGEGGMFGSGPGSDTYADWFDQNLAEKVASSGHIGIKDQLMRDFERHGEIPRTALEVVERQTRAAAANRATFTAMQAKQGGIDVVH